MSASSSPTPTASVRYRPVPSYSRRSLVACMLGTLILRAASSIAGSTIQLYFGFIDQHVYTLSDTARGLALGVFFLPELIGSPAFGAWSDRLGRKRFMVLGVLFGGLGAEAVALTTNYVAIVAARLLGGLSTASAIPATLSYLSAITSHSEALRGRIMGLFQLATLAGTMAGILAGGRLWDLFHQNAFALDAALYLLGLLVFFFGVLEPPPAFPNRRSRLSVLKRGVAALGKTFEHYRETFTSPAVLRFAPAFVAINVILGIWLNHFIGQVVAADRHFPDQLLYGILANNRNAGTDISLYGAAILAIFILGVIAWSLFVGRIKRTFLMLVDGVDLFALVALLFALNHSHSLTSPLAIGVIALAVIALFVLSGIMPAALTFLADVTEERSEDRGAIMGLYTILFGLGGFLGTLIGGPFADWGGVDGILAATALLGVIAFVLLLRLHLGEERIRT